MADGPLIDPTLVAPDPPQGSEIRASALRLPTLHHAVGDVQIERERYANRIAQIITWTFAATAVLLLIGIFLVVLVRPTMAETLLSKAVIPALTQSGTFLTSTFGSLLAFVLGYYFKSKEDKGVV